MPTISLSFDSTGAAQAATEYERSVEQIDRAAARAVAAQERVNAAIRGRSVGDLSQAANAQAQAVERVTAATTRSAGAIGAEERAIIRRTNAGLTALSTLGGESRAYAQLTRDSIRRAETLGVEINRTELLSQVQARLASTAALPAQAFSTQAVNARDLRLNLQGLNQTMSLLSTQFGAFGPIVAQGFGVVRQTISEARRELEAFKAAGAGAAGGDVASIAARRQAGAGLIGVGIGAGVLSLAAISAGALKAASEIDELDDKAKRLGLTIGQLQGLQILGAETDLPDVSRKIEELEKRLGDLGDNSGRAKEAFEILGLNFQRVRQLAPVDALAAISDAYVGLSSENDRAAVRVKLFGDAIGETDEFLRSGGRTLQEYADRLGISAEKVIRASELHKQFNGALERTKVSLLNGLGPTAIEILDVFRLKLETMIGAVARLASGLGEIFDRFGSLNSQSPDTLRSQIGDLNTQNTRLVEAEARGADSAVIQAGLDRNNERLAKLHVALALVEDQAPKTKQSIGELGAAHDDLSGSVQKAGESVSDFIAKMKEDQGLAGLADRARAIQQALDKASEIRAGEGIGAGLRPDEAKEIAAVAASTFDLTSARKLDAKAATDAARSQAEWNAALFDGAQAASAGAAANESSLSAIERSNDAMRGGKDSLAAYNTELRIEQLVLEQMKNEPGPISEPQLQRIRDGVTEAERLTKALSETERAEQEATRQRQQQIENAARAAQEPWLEAARNIQRGVSDALFQAFRHGVSSAKDFASLVKDIFARLAAELVTVNLFGGLFGQLGGGATSGGGLLSGLLGGGGGSGLFGNLLSGAGSLVGTLFGGGATQGGAINGLEDETVQGLSAAVNGLTQSTGVLSRLGSFVGLGAGGTGNAGFLSLGNLAGGGGGFSLSAGAGVFGGAGALALPLAGYGLGRLLGVKGPGRDLITAGLTGVGGALAGAYGASAITAGAGALGAGVGTASGIAGTISGLSSYLGPLGWILASIGFGIGNIGKGGAGSQAHHIITTGENPYAGTGKGSASAAFDAGMSTGSVTFAIAAGIGALFAGKAKSLGFDLTTGGGTPGFGEARQGPFGQLGFNNVTEAFPRKTDNGRNVLDAIESFDKAVAAVLNTDEIERVTAQLAGFEQSIRERPKHFADAFVRLLGSRFAEITKGLEGEAVGQAVGARFNKLGGSSNDLEAVIQEFFTQRKAFQDGIAQLSGTTIPEAKQAFDALKAKLDEITAATPLFSSEIEKLNAAYETGRQKVGKDFADSLEIRRLNREGNPLAAALIAQAKDAESLLANARYIDAQLGLNTIVAAEREAAADRLAIIADFAKQANAPFEDLRKQLTIGDLGGLSIPARFSAAQAAFEKERADAIANPNSLTERSELVSAFTTFFELSKEQFGSGQRTEDIRQIGLGIADTFTSTFAAGGPVALPADASTATNQVAQTAALTQLVALTQEQADELVNVKNQLATMAARLDAALSDLARQTANT